MSIQRKLGAHCPVPLRAKGRAGRVVRWLFLDRGGAGHQRRVVQRQRRRAVLQPFLSRGSGAALQNETDEGRDRANFALEGILDGAKVGNIKNADEYVDYQMRRAIQDKSFRDTLTDADENGEGWTEMSPNRQKEFFKEQWAEMKKASPDLHLLVITKDKDYEEVDLSNPAGYTKLNGIIKREAKTKGGKELLSSILDPFYSFLDGRDSNPATEDVSNPILEKKTKTIKIGNKTYEVPIEG